METYFFILSCIVVTIVTIAAFTLKKGEYIYREMHILWVLGLAEIIYHFIK